MLKLPMAKEQLYIGIDGGGSTTRAALANVHGDVLGVGFSGAANAHFSGLEVTTQSIGQAINEAFQSAGIKQQSVHSAWLGLAGMGRPQDREQLQRRLHDLAEQVAISHDMHIALRGGLKHQPGIALIAGTGSACYGINADGKTWRCGGWGEPADDIGSASWFSLRACQIAVRQADGRLSGDEPMQTVFDFLNIDDVLELPLRIQELSRNTRAAMTPLLTALYNLHNPHIKAIFTHGVTELANLVATTAHQLELPNAKVVLLGGLARSGPPFQPLLETQIRQRLPLAQVIEPHYEPMLGALMEAYTQCGIPLTADRLARLAK